MIDAPSPALEAASQPEQSTGLGRYKLKRWLVIVSAGILFLLVTGALGFRMAVQTLKGKVIEALGPGSEVNEIKVGWSSIELIGLNIAAPKGWPAARMLHAERVVIEPSLRSLLSDRVQIASITVKNPYLSVVREPGKLIILPSLLESERPKTKTQNDLQSPRRVVVISKIALENGTMEVFDKTVSRPPLKIRLEQIEAVVDNVVPGHLKERTGFELKAVAKGKTRDGQLKVSGWVAAGKDSSSHIVMEKVDLVTLQPYLVKTGDAQISDGTLDLNVKSEVRSNQLDGTGNMIIKDLQFAPSRNYLGTFMGLPRNAVLSFLKDHNNAIDVDFTLSGDIRHPNFSLNETLATRVATGMAGQLGMSIQGLAEGLGTLGRKGLEGASGTANAIGSAFKSLFSGGENR